MLHFHTQLNETTFRVPPPPAIISHIIVCVATRSNPRPTTMKAEDGSTDADFIRFMGGRIVDADSDERNCTVVNGKAMGSLRTDASLLAVSNRYGSIFVGSTQGFRWAWLSELRTGSKAGTTSDTAAAAMHEGASHTKPPFLLALNSDDTRLALICDEDADASSVALYDVLDVLNSRCRSGFCALLALLSLRSSPCAPQRVPVPASNPKTARQIPSPLRFLALTEMRLLPRACARACGEQW